MRSRLPAVRRFDLGAHVRSVNIEGEEDMMMAVGQKAF